MSDWYDTFDSVFWVTIGTMTFAFLGIVIKTALASKCDNLNICWGCVTVHRVVELERDISMPISTNNNTSSTSI